MILQAHFLTSYGASLLNRDDAGFAKRIDFGGFSRVRTSSQCLKRSWRETLMALKDECFPTGVRSTSIFETRILPAVVATGIPELRARAGLRVIIEKVFKGGADSVNATSLITKQAVLLGNREVAFITSQVAEALKLEGKAEDLVGALIKGTVAKSTLTTLMGLADPLAYGVESALFGRFVTSDLLARTDASVSVSHAITVHEAATELDFFTAVDDISITSGAAHLDEAELSSGLFYLYLSIDVPLLTANITGCAPEDWAAQDLTVVRALISMLLTLAATKSPGAKKGSTAPFAYSDFVLLEVSKEQPRQLVNAFLKPVKVGQGSLMDASVAALGAFLAKGDKMYGPTTLRSYATTCDGVVIAGAAEGLSLAMAVEQAINAATSV